MGFICDVLVHLSQAFSGLFNLLLKFKEGSATSQSSQEGCADAPKGGINSDNNCVKI